MRPRIEFLLLITLLLQGVSAAAADKDDGSGSGALLLGSGAAVVGAALFLDRPIRHGLYPGRTSGAVTDLRRFGDAAQLAGPVLGTLFYLQGRNGRDPKSVQTARLAWESFLVAGGAELATKFLVGRRRPSQTDGPYRFHPFGHDSSFPSGHTTAAFAAATTFAEQYPRAAVAVPAYAAASAVAVSRLAANEHWLSDVLAGAALGAAVAHVLGKKDRERQDWTVEINSSSIQVARRF